MTSEEIRRKAHYYSEKLDDSETYSVVMLRSQFEIAAQLAELNEFLVTMKSFLWDYRRANKSKFD